MTRIWPFIVIVSIVRLGVCESAYAVNQQDVISGILANDSKIRSIEVEYRVELGLVGDQPGASIDSVWIKDGRRQLLRDDTGFGIVTTGYDGTVVRGLNTPKGDSATAVVKAVPQADFALGNYRPEGFSGRYIWGQELLGALEKGKATASQQLVSFDGAHCFEVTGHMLTAVESGVDAMWFKAYLDSDHGCMPRYIEEYSRGPDGVSTSRTIMDQYIVSEIIPGVWFPASLVQRGQTTNKKGEWETATINRITIHKIRINTPQPEATFLVKFPSGTKVADYVLGHSSQEPLITTVTTAPILEDQFSSIREQVENAAGHGPSSLTNQSNGSTNKASLTRIWTFGFFGFVILVILAVGVGLMIRIRKSRSSVDRH